jgi:mono/diheme cytochrome c family protein
MSFSEERMKRSGFLFLCLLIVCAQYAFARQEGDGLNEQQRLGRQVVAQACGVCHLPPARNARTYGPLLSKAAGGGDDGVVRGFILDGTSRMPAFKYFLRPAEIDAIIAYLRTVPVQAPTPASPAK